MFHFEAIRWGNGDLWWLLLVPLALVPAWVSYELFHRRVDRSFTGSALLPSMVRGAGFGRRLGTFLCILAALELLAVAALRPRYGLKDFAVKGVGVDVAIVLDASRSMKASDVVPDRLGASVLAISRLLDSMKGNRVALVPFAGLSFIQSPLTVDHAVIKQYMNDLRVTDIPVPGTALGRALTTAGRALGVDSAMSSGSAHKAVIVFTDGENHEGTPEEIAAALSEKGVKVFTVGVGTPEGKPVPQLDEKGQVTGLTRQEDGVSPVISKLDEKLLKDIADKTGGRFFRLASTSDGVELAAALSAEIDTLEKAEYRSAVERLLEDRFQYPLGAAVFFMLLPFLSLGRWKSVRRASRGAAVAVLVLAVFGSRDASAQPFEHPILSRFFNIEHSGVNDARELMRQGKYGDALKKFQEISSSLPPAPAIDYDIAIAAFKSGDFNAAVESVDKAITRNDGLPSTSPLKLKKAALLHAKGTILAEKARRLSVEKQNPRDVRKVYRDAVDSLVAALILDPENAATRRNVEITAAAAYPPCSNLDDKNEPNNDSGSAAFLTPDPNTLSFKGELLLCPGDEDWFKLPVNPEETVFISVEKPAPQGQDAQPGPDQGGQQKPEPADVDISRVGPDGILTGNPSKQIRFSASGDSAPGTPVLFRITGPAFEDGVDYVLSAQIAPPCPSGDDQMEPNDTSDALKQIQDGDLSLRVCPGNDDWFEYTEKQGAAKEVSIRYGDQDGPLELEVLTADGAPMDVSSTPGPDGLTKSVTLPKAEQDAVFRIRVAGGGAQGFYNLSIQDPKGGQQNQQNQDQPQNRQQEQQGSRTMREMLDDLDSNQENLEAQEAGRNSPMKDYRPQKDW